MVALMLERAGLDPTAVIGGRLSAFGSNARLGRGQYMVAEADESDRSFLKLSPAIAVITNIDREHWRPTARSIGSSRPSQTSPDRVPFYGAVVACVDDPPVARAGADGSRGGSITYGFCRGRRRARRRAPSTDGHVGTLPRALSRSRGVPDGVGRGRARSSRVPGRTTCRTRWRPSPSASSSACRSIGSRSALAEFRGAERRYQTARRRARRHRRRRLRPSSDRDCRRARAPRAAGAPTRLVAVFQPHRYTRTRDLLDEFGPALALADVVVLTDIYAGG